jgi:hypothetical protein
VLSFEEVIGRQIMLRNSEIEWWKSEGASVKSASSNSIILFLNQRNPPWPEIVGSVKHQNIRKIVERISTR